MTDLDKLIRVKHRLCRLGLHRWRCLGDYRLVGTGWLQSQERCDRCQKERMSLS